MRIVLLLLSLQLFCVSGNTDIEFGGFEEGATYTYYTNGVNEYTELTCTATSDTYTTYNTVWIRVSGYIHVMTENVSINCDADMALWYYTPVGLTYSPSIPNPAIIDRFTTQNARTYYCTSVNVNNNREVVDNIRLRTYGSGVYKQQQDTYTQLTEGESVHITEDTTLVCVTSTPGFIRWFYRNIITEVDERIEENTRFIQAKRFLTLSLQNTSRAGNYYCEANEVTKYNYDNVRAEHNFIVSVPTVRTIKPTTTPQIVTTTPQIATTTTATVTPTTTKKSTQASTKDATPPYPIIGLGGGILVAILILVILVVTPVIVCMVERKTSNRSGHIEQMQTNNTEDATIYVNNNKEEYVNLQELPVSPVSSSNTEKSGYKKFSWTDTPITSPIKSLPEDKDGYMNLEQLEGSLGVRGESDPCVEKK